MPTGKVKWFNSEKQYGFITPDEGGRDVFLHQKSLDRSGVRRLPQDGERITFDVEQRDKGPSATNVKLG